MSRIKADMVVLTGDYMSAAGDEGAAYEIMRQITHAVQPRLGMFGVFGNHDSPALRHYMRDLPVHWLVNRRVNIAGGNIEILGLDVARSHHFDPIRLMLNDQADTADEAGNGDASHRPLRIMLAHLPELMTCGSDLRADLVLSGHTHGGQCRLPGRIALTNSTHMPLSLTSGIMRHRHTLSLVPRGLGEVRLPLRVFCPPQLPVYRLQRGPMPGKHTSHIVNLEPW